MTFASLLADIDGRLDRAGVPYMLTGSLASSFHGEPRASLDLDLVADPDPDSLARLIDELRAGGYYVDRDAAGEALETRGQFNAIDANAVKVDFIIRKDRPFSIEEFRRRQAVEVLGRPTFIATVEDLILAKLEWASATGSERQLRDVSALIEAAGTSLDNAYIARWIGELGIDELYDRVRSGAR